MSTTSLLQEYITQKIPSNHGVYVKLQERNLDYNISEVKITI